MSQTTSIIYGYGFKIANFDKNLINFNDFKNFLLKNKSNKKIKRKQKEKSYEKNIININLFKSA